MKKLFPLPFSVTLLLVSFVSALIVFFLHYSYFVSYLTFPIIPGADTMGHVELGKYYAEHIFPASWGWAPQWYGGMPFPQFYPPLFYFLVAFFYKILPFGYDTIFRFFTFFLSLALPGLFALVASRFTRFRSSLWVAGISAAFLLATPFGKYTNLGVSLISTFTVGLVAHLLGFVFFLLWLWAFLGRKESKKLYYLSIFFLAATALSSIHVLPGVALIYLISFCFDSPHNFIKHYLIPGLLAVGLTAYWFVPFLGVQEYMPDQSLGLTNGIGAKGVWIVIKTWWPTAFFFVLAICIAWYKRSRIIATLLLSTLFCLILVVLEVDEVFESFPLHTYRILPFVYFSGALFAAYVYDRCAKYFHAKSRFFLVAAFSLIFMIAWVPYIYDRHTSDYYYSYKEEKAFEIADFLKGREGMYAVEATNNSRLLNYVIGQGASESLRSNYAVLVESSPNSLFHVPFRSSLTYGRGERLSVHSLLANSNEFRKSKDPTAIAARARALGVQYLVIKSDALKKVLNTNAHFKLAQDFGAWTIYELSEKVADARILSFGPHVIFSDIGIKGIKPRSLDFMLVQEQLFLGDLTDDVVVARADDMRLDATPDLSRFGSAIIVDYKYTSQEKAFENLFNYAKNNRLVLISSTDPLFARLKIALRENSNVSFVEYDLAIKGQALYDTLKVVASSTTKILAQHKKSVAHAGSVDLTLTQKKISLALENKDREVPVLVNSSYFPAWQRVDSEPIFMATPAYILTFAKNPIELVFNNPWMVYVGYLITTTSLFVVAVLVYRDFKKRKKLV